jgi:hypothetical protein
MESGLTMLLHSVIIALILYMIMIYALGQNKTVDENRSILFGGLILVYMILFGHGLPTTINKGLF